jgi:ABC-type Mn2+/Zn2+ transport system permease subunit
MELTWLEIFEFFGLAIAAAVLAGVVCPLVGAFLLLRRTSFYGLVLPQFAATGVAFGFVAMPWWIAHVGLGSLSLEAAMEDTHATLNYHLAWAAAFTFSGLGALVWLGRSGLGSEVARVAAAFAIASAATILFAHSSPTGEIFVHELLQGQIITIGLHEFETFAAVLAISLALFVIFNRDFLVISFDRESSVVLGKPVVAFEALLMLITGATISVGVMTVGPIVLFGLLVLPPIAARSIASTMTGYFTIASLLGVVASVGGVWTSFYFDWPIGPAVVVVAALLLIPSTLVGRLMHTR